LPFVGRPGAVGGVVVSATAEGGGVANVRTAIDEVGRARLSAALRAMDAMVKGRVESQIRADSDRTR